MYADLLRQLELSLHLNKKPVGIHFFLIPEEYDDAAVPSSDSKMSICSYINQAAEKKIRRKISWEHVSCTGGLSALGLKKPGNFVKSGKQFFLMRLYESMAVARKVISQLGFMEMQIYGFEIGPLEQLNSADVVIILGNAWQMMRMVHGYTFHYGVPENLGTAGNQGVCADLAARPFQKNDFNFSMLCPGARIHMKSSENEMGCGMPIHQFKTIAASVVATTSLAMTRQEKLELLKRMNSPSDLDCKIELDKMYGTYHKNSPYPHELYDRQEKVTERDFL